VGLTVDRIVLQALREGCNYLQFEEKLLALHLAGLDIGSINHSVKFIEGFVDSMTVLMDRKIREHLHVVDPVTCRKCLFAFATDKVTEFHRTVDAIGMLIMTEEGELKAMFTKHTGHALMSKIYEETFVKKLGLTPKHIWQQCT
jgi:hypothetical protein